MKALDKCTICPRECGVNRNKGYKGRCKEDSKVKLARAALHMWEEPCISGENGSGAIFFTGCPLGCVFCQNYRIQSDEVGKEVSIERLSDIMLELQNKKANNINLVTPTHYTLHIIKALELAKKKGLTIPIVYNTSGYEKVETLKLLEGYVDVYLPDVKYYEDCLAEKYSAAAGYFDVAKKALDEMYRQVGKCVFNTEGIITKGVITRHMIIPAHTINAKQIIKYIYDRYSNDVYISIMNQYTPVRQFDENYKELNRTVTKREYDKVINYAISIGVTNAYIQEGKVAKQSFIPEFNYDGL